MGNLLPNDCMESLPLVSGDFNYSSLVGILLYLAGWTCTDITYAVNFTARYMFFPKLVTNIHSSKLVAT